MCWTIVEHLLDYPRTCVGLVLNMSWTREENVLDYLEHLLDCRRTCVGLS